MSPDWGCNLALGTGGGERAGESAGDVNGNPICRGLIVLRMDPDHVFGHVHMILPISWSPHSSILQPRLSLRMQASFMKLNRSCALRMPE